MWVSGGRFCVLGDGCLCGVATRPAPFQTADDSQLTSATMALLFQTKYFTKQNQKQLGGIHGSDVALDTKCWLRLIQSAGYV